MFENGYGLVVAGQRRFLCIKDNFQCMEVLVRIIYFVKSLFLNLKAILNNVTWEKPFKTKIQRFLSSFLGYVANQEFL